MGTEDREWWREERRQQGYNASWDNFRPKPDTESPALEAGNILRIQRPIKLSTPSHGPLHAQQVLDTRSATRTGRLLLILGMVACSSLVAVGYFVF